MEHRWSRRQALKGEILVSLSGGRTQVLALADLSLGGIAVATETPFPVDAFATVSFSVELDEGPTVIRLLSQVVHSRPMTTGFMFVDPGYETLRGLRETLARAASAQARSPSVALRVDGSEVIDFADVRQLRPASAG